MDNQHLTLKEKRPLPPRPINGFAAWQATLGYIARRYSEDAILSVEVYPLHKGVLTWSAEVSWNNIQESVNTHLSLSDALAHLWLEVESKYTIFDSPNDLSRCPAGYNDDEWLDAATQETLHRLIRTSWSVFLQSWCITFKYRPVEDSVSRVQMILTVNQNDLYLQTHGASLLDACRDLFRRAVPVFAAQSGVADQSESFVSQTHKQNK